MKFISAPFALNEMRILADRMSKLSLNELNFY